MIIYAVLHDVHCNFLITITPDTRTSGSRRDSHRSILMTPSLISPFLKKNPRQRALSLRWDSLVINAPTN